MASLVTSLLSGGLLGGISTLINTIRGKSPEDALKLAELAGKYQSDILQADVDSMKGQLEVNKTEAASSDKFTSRWRPSVGYTCTAAFAMNYVVGPLLNWGSALAGHPAAFPQLDMTTMMPILLGLLGLGGLRSWEKVNKAA